MSKQKFAIALALILACCGMIAVAWQETRRQNVELPETTSTVEAITKAATAELLRNAQKEFDAGRFVESLKIAMAIQPEENKQNQPQYGEYYADLDDIEYGYERKSSGNPWARSHSSGVNRRTR